MSRRPTALDRNLANVFRAMKHGQYKVVVRSPEVSSLRFMEPAALKVEGGFEIELDGKRISVIPEIHSP